MAKKSSTEISKALIDKSKPKLTPSKVFIKLKGLKEKLSRAKTPKAKEGIRKDIRLAKKEQNSSIAFETGRLSVDISGKNFQIKKSYLGKLKDPTKYIEGLYARSLRHEQKKAYKKGNSNAVVNYENKLRGIGKKSGVSYYKVKKSRDVVVKNIEKVFGKLSKEAKKRLTKVLRTEKYTPITTYSNGSLTINYI